MDDLLSEFLTETNESLDVVDVELVKFEQEPNNAKILDNVFRLVHTIKGTCGFLGLPRLEALAHAAETLMGKFRDGAPVTQEAVSLILTSIDRIKEILADLETAGGAEPEGSDDDLISELERLSLSAETKAAPGAQAEEPAADTTTGDIVEQSLERPLRPGEVSLDDLERAFRDGRAEIDRERHGVAEALRSLQRRAEQRRRRCAAEGSHHVPVRPGGPPHEAAIVRRGQLRGEVERMKGRCHGSRFRTVGTLHLLPRGLHRVHDLGGKKYGAISGKMRGQGAFRGLP